MVRINFDELVAAMPQSRNIRNFSVIAHVDHGKSTLTDSLLAYAGIIAQKEAGKARGLDTREDEQERGISIKSSGVTMSVHLPDDVAQPKESASRHFLANIIDSPGHVDFSSEVTAALRVTDGALVVVCAIEGVAVQTRTVLRQALAERIKPALVLNKLDRCILEKQMDSESIYLSLRNIIEDVNSNIALFSDPKMSDWGDWSVQPDAGSVAFASGYIGFAFTLDTFARFYARKLGASVDKLRKRLWGDHFYDDVLHKWTQTARTEDGRVLQRGFCRFVMDPVRKAMLACMAASEQPQALEKIASSVNVTLSETHLQLPPKDLLRAFMQQWLPAANAIIELIVHHLPSPDIAQRYRCEVLYTGAMDDETAGAIKSCDAAGPLTVYVSKMIPSSEDATRFFALGRVFSGTITSGMKVFIMGPDYEPVSKRDLHEKTIQRCMLMMGKRFEAVSSVPAGNIVAILGVDQSLSKCGTLTSLPGSMPIRNLQHSVAPVVSVCVEVKNPKDLAALIAALRRLDKTDQLVNIYVDENTGQHIVSGAGELHLEVCLGDLRRMLSASVELVVHQPQVAYRETVLSPSSIVCLAKTNNKHNRLWVRAEPMEPSLLKAIDSGAIHGDSEAKHLSSVLVAEHGWNLLDTKKIWAFGPDGPHGTNLFVDQSRAVRYLHESRDTILGGFHWATREGVLMQEPQRGVRYNLEDALLHADRAHRRVNQLVPAARRVCVAATLSAQPAVLEPVFLCDVLVPTDAAGPVYTILNKRRGTIVEVIDKGLSMMHIMAHLPISESFGFPQELRGATGGKAFPQMIFDHWAVMPGDPLVDDGNKACEAVKAKRIFKGLDTTIPQLDSFLDRL